MQFQTLSKQGGNCMETSPPTKSCLFICNAKLILKDNLVPHNEDYRSFQGSWNHRWSMFRKVDNNAFVCFTSQQHAQVRICSITCACRHTEIQLADQSCLSHPIIAYWQQANNPQCWPYNTRCQTGEPLEHQCLSHWCDSPWKNIHSKSGNWTQVCCSWGRRLNTRQWTDEKNPP